MQNKVIGDTVTAHQTLYHQLVTGGVTFAFDTPASAVTTSNFECRWCAKDLPLGPTMAESPLECTW